MLVPCDRGRMVGFRVTAHACDCATVGFWSAPRFDLAVKEGRKAAMVPANGGAIGQVLGTISSALYAGGSKTNTDEDGPTSQTFSEVWPAETAGGGVGLLHTFTHAHR